MNTAYWRGRLSPGINSEDRAHLWDRVAYACRREAMRVYVVAIGGSDCPRRWQAIIAVAGLCDAVLVLLAALKSVLLLFWRPCWSRGSYFVHQGQGILLCL